MPIRFRIDEAHRSLFSVAGNESSKTKLFVQLISRFAQEAAVFDDFAAACSWVGIDRNEAESALNMRREPSKHSSLL